MEEAIIRKQGTGSRPWTVFRLEPFGTAWGLRNRFACVQVSNGFRTRREAREYAASLALKITTEARHKKTHAG